MSTFSARLSGLIVRDTAIVTSTLALWHLVPRGSLVLAIATALMTVVVAYLTHEWGHLLGALASRSAFELPRTPFSSFFLFRFDRVHNTRAQFVAMALGGFAASALTVIVLVAVLPRETAAGLISLALVGLGVLATLVIEVPEFLRVWRGGPLPDGAAFVSGPPGSDAPR